MPPPVFRDSASGVRGRLETPPRKQSAAGYGLLQSAPQLLHRSGSDRSEYGGNGPGNRAGAEWTTVVEPRNPRRCPTSRSRRVTGTLSDIGEKTADWESMSEMRPP